MGGSDSPSYAGPSSWGSVAGINVYRSDRDASLYRPEFRRGSDTVERGAEQACQ